MISLPSVWLSSVAGQATIFPQRVSVAARIFLRPRPLRSARPSSHGIHSSAQFGRAPGSIESVWIFSAEFIFLILASD
jgi:hypothetical protein